MDFGGVTGGFQTPMNTVGIGDPVPGGYNYVGSGDLFWGASQQGKKPRKKAPLQGKIPAHCNFGQFDMSPRPLIVMSDKNGN